ncbi:hypothetical protein C1Y35_14560 [Pseudomonas sp. GW456-L14]|nr:hypothetical protein C1Y35_14560 [Pseudomonas sp. GW456-L14]PMY57953.1 hypothetical protein C1Y34_08330 [Pseudomonas sp. GW456-L12]
MSASKEQLNGRPMAHLGSPTSHGGKIITGSGDTFGGVVFGPTLGGLSESVLLDGAGVGQIGSDSWRVIKNPKRLDAG